MKTKKTEKLEKIPAGTILTRLQPNVRKKRLVVLSTITDFHGNKVLLVEELDFVPGGLFRAGRGHKSTLTISCKYVENSAFCTEYPRYRIVE